MPVFITMRDPISRSVSAFNWLNPRGGACAAFAETNCRRGGKMSSRLYGLLRQYLESDYEIVHRLEAYAAIAATI